MTVRETAYDDAVRALAMRLHGQIVQPGDDEFEAARGVWNATVERVPALIVRCADAHDVAMAIAFAREQGLPLSVRSGGHSLAGYGANDGGVVIDLSPFKAISIDPATRIARIEAGLTWAEVAAAAHEYGLALTSGDMGTVGVGGLTLGGGIGWMARKHGLTIDNLLAVEIVTADGQQLRASEDEHAELFWGLRGGGGNFGVATAFEFRLHPGGLILGGAVFYDAAEAGAVLRSYARYAATAPDELTTMAMLMPAPPLPFIPPSAHGTPIVAILACHSGDLSEGERVVAPLRSLSTPLAEVLGPMPYPALFALTAEGAARGRHQIRSAFLRALDDDALETIATYGAALPSPTSIAQLRILGGAMSRVPSEATAFVHRDKPAMFSIFDCWEDATGSARQHAWMEEFWTAMQPHAGGVYVNFLGDEGEARIRAAYSPATYARLAALKDRYDPTNLFRLNQNIRPTMAVETRQRKESAA